jgi:hypothetical protein
LGRGGGETFDGAVAARSIEWFAREGRRQLAGAKAFAGRGRLTGSQDHPPDASANMVRMSVHGPDARRIEQWVQQRRVAPDGVVAPE